MAGPTRQAKQEEGLSLCRTVANWLALPCSVPLPIDRTGQLTTSERRGPRATTGATRERRAAGLGLGLWPRLGPRPRCEGQGREDTDSEVSVNREVSVRLRGRRRRGRPGPGPGRRRRTNVGRAAQQEGRQGGGRGRAYPPSLSLPSRAPSSILHRSRVARFGENNAVPSAPFRRRVVRYTRPTCSAPEVRCGRGRERLPVTVLCGVRTGPVAAEGPPHTTVMNDNSQFLLTRVRLSKSVLLT